MAENPVAEIRRLVGFPDQYWKVLCEPMMPEASDCEALDLVRRALMLRQGFFLPVGAVAEDIYRLRDIWTYAVFITALMRKGMDMSIIPRVGMQWLESNVECMRNIHLALENPPRGTIHEIMAMTSGTPVTKGKGLKGHPASSPDEKGEREKVQSELLSAPRDTPTDSASMVDREAPRPGNMFLEWLRKGIRTGEITVNKRDARVHVVSDGALIVSPNTFKEFDKDHWASVQNDFLSMGLHHPGVSNNFITYAVAGSPGITIKGILLPDASLLFDVTPSPNQTLARVQESR